MYAGSTKNWASGEPVRVVLRPASETDTKTLRSLSDDMAPAAETALERPGLISATNEQSVAETLERLPGSTGVIALGQIATEKRQLKVLPVNGVMPIPGANDPWSRRFIKSF